MITVGYTENFISRYIAEQFYKGVPNSILKKIEICFCENLLISYGVLRGSYEKMKQSKNFFYVDHGYISGMKRIYHTDPLNNHKITLLPKPGSEDFNKSYFRICYNSLFDSGVNENFNNKRFDKIGFKLNFKKKRGEKILLIPPDENIADKYHGIKNWEKNIVNEIKKYSDRKIIVSKKHDKKKAKDFFNEAYVIVTAYSNAGIEGMLNGIPVIFTHKDRKNFDIKNIEKTFFDPQLLYNLAHYQWNIYEIRSGEAWENMKIKWLKNLNKNVEINDK